MQDVHGEEDDGIDAAQLLVEHQEYGEEEGFSDSRILEKKMQTISFPHLF